MLGKLNEEQTNLNSFLNPNLSKLFPVFEASLNPIIYQPILLKLGSIS